MCAYYVYALNMPLSYSFTKTFSVLTLFIAALGQTAHAQTLPPSADPSRQNLPIWKEDDFAKIKQQSQEKQTDNAPSLPNEVANIKFVLKSLVLDGATGFPQNKLQQIYQNDVGTEITLGRLFEIMRAVQQLYYDSGYTLSQVFIPEQNIQDGRIKLQVIEGYVAEVDIDTALIPSDIISGFKSDVLSMYPLNTRKLERLMLILNDRPALDVSSVLSATDSKNAHGKGAVKLTLKQNVNLKVKNKYVEFDNYGSSFSGSGQTTVGMNITRNLPNYSDLLTSFVQTTSAREMRQGYLSYNIPVFGASGTTIHVSSSLTFTEPGGNLDDLDIKGKSGNVSASVSYPIIRQRDQSFIVEAGFDYKNTKTDILDERLSEDRTRAVALQARYSFSDRYKGINILNLKYAQGFDILNERPSGSEELSREDGQSDYKKLEFSASRLQSITAHIDLIGSIRGQYTHDPLLSSEEFGFGGGYLGRGYDPSEIAGDNGIALSLEARYKSMLHIYNTPLNYQLYTFYDFGKIWNIDPSEKGNVSAASFGAGTRVQLSDQYSMDLNFALPLTKSVNNSPKYTDENSPRVLFSFKYQF